MELSLNLTIKSNLDIENKIHQLIKLIRVPLHDVTIISFLAKPCLSVSEPPNNN